ncbi:hypothetical protein FSARC_9893 [Fusarium sarcochroum]|uniref:SRR1-like domain-containing protein n=1 Tax=Fusarium sarcochroum TaxID=1208366 RepID=A0A8H4TQ27_9HYPO|nr:hypothetical protein FSARC_9893 [Fusarium sarcochroum]
MSSSQGPQEWTHVTRKSRKSKNSNQGSPSHSHINSLPVTPRTESLRSPSDLKVDYDRYRSRWTAETPCLRLRELVSSKASHLKDINRAINFGVGTFDPADGAWEAKRSTFVQLAAFEIIVEELEKITGKKIECFLQDPVFSASDKSFLSNLGHTVVEDPAGCDLVNENTFFFGVHLYKPIYTEALAKHLPAIFVGTGWNAWDALFSSEGLGNMETMHKTYEACEFPQEEFDPAFSTTTIYWKPKAGSKEVEEETKEETKEETAGDEKVEKDEKVDKSEKQKEEEDELSRKLESTTIS